MLLTVIPFWYYCQKQCFERHREFNITLKKHFENITLKALVLIVIPLWYCVEQHRFDSNTVLVLLSKECFDRHRQFNNTSDNHFEKKYFENISFESDTILEFLCKTLI